MDESVDREDVLIINIYFLCYQKLTIVPSHFIIDALN